MTHDEFIASLPKTFLGFTLIPDVLTHSKNGQVTSAHVSKLYSSCGSFNISVHGMTHEGMKLPPEGRYEADWIVAGNVITSLTASSFQNLQVGMFDAIEKATQAVAVSKEHVLATYKTHVLASCKTCKDCNSTNT